MVIVQVVCASSGGSTPHDGRYVVAWHPHTEYGTLDLTSTTERRLAHRFDSPKQAMQEWRTVSERQRLRPDGKENRPLTGITIAIEAAE